MSIAYVGQAARSTVPRRQIQRDFPVELRPVNPASKLSKLFPTAYLSAIGEVYKLKKQAHPVYFETVEENDGRFYDEVKSIGEFLYGAPSGSPIMTRDEFTSSRAVHTRVEHKGTSARGRGNPKRLSFPSEEGASPPRPVPTGDTNPIVDQYVEALASAVSSGALPPDFPVGRIKESITDGLRKLHQGVDMRDVVTSFIDRVSDLPAA